MTEDERLERLYATAIEAGAKWVDENGRVIAEFKQLNLPITVEQFEEMYMAADRVFDGSKSHEWTFDGLNWTDKQIAAVQAAMSDPPAPSEQPETTVERHVDAVIDHLNKGRVVPRKVDELAGAVARARTDGAVGRAIGSKGFK